MFSKIIITILALMLSVASFGAEESKAQEALKFVKERFSFSYHGEYYYSHNSSDNKLRDVDQLHNPTLTYKIAQDWKFSASAEFKYSDHYKVGYPNRFWRALFSVTRENVLTEKENGVKLDLGVARRVFDQQAMSDLKTRLGADWSRANGNTRLTSNLSKTLPWGNGKHSASLFAQYLYNDPQDVDATTWKHSVELIPGINLQLTEQLTYALLDDMVFNTSKYTNNPGNTSLTHEAYSTLTYKYNDKISPYFQLKYVHNEEFSVPGHGDSDEISYFIGLGCAVTPKITLTPEIGNKMFTSSDERTMSEKFKYIDLALYADISF